MASDFKRAELLSYDFGRLVERCLVSESAWADRIEEIERLKLQIAELEKQICIYIQIDNIRYCPMCDGDLTSFYLGEQK